MTDLTPDQIAASRNRLLAEGFHPDSNAVRVHEQLLAVMQANRMNVEGACQSMEDLKAECERLRAEREWRPIETAPKAQEILVYCTRMREIGTAKWMENWGRWGDTWVISGFNQPWASIPSHWMPLPQVPASATESGAA